MAVGANNLFGSMDIIHVVGMVMESQWKRILDYLESGNKITPVEALDMFGSFRLSERIREIEAKGYKIERGWYSSKGGALVRQYWLVTEQQTRMAI
jgi:hypothetical protein